MEPVQTRQGGGDNGALALPARGGRLGVIGSLPPTHTAGVRPKPNDICCTGDFTTS